jgi:hypothetical protein
MVQLVRLLHGAFTAFFLSCFAYVYYAAIRRRRDPLVYGALGALALEGAVVFANGGDCPLGRVHRRYGDDRDFFEMLMPRRISKRAVRSFRWSPYSAQRLSCCVHHAARARAPA